MIMKKQAFSFCFFALPALLLGGCDKDSGPDFTDGSPVVIEIAGASLEGIISSRATTPISSGSIGVFRTTANAYTAQYNAKYTYKNGAWTADPNPVYVGGDNATLCACYPHGAATFDTNSFVCTLTAQKWTADKDLCYATTGGPAVCNHTPEVSFTLTHAYSRIKLNIQRDAAHFTGNCKITNVNLKNSTGNNFFSSRTLDISKGTYGGSATPAGWNYNPNITAIAAGATNNTAYDVLVPPQSVNGGLTITLKADGKDRAVTVPAGKFTSNELAAGQQYVIYLLMTDTSIVVSGVSLADWTVFSGSMDSTFDIS